MCLDFSAFPKKGQYLLDWQFRIAFAGTVDCMGRAARLKKTPTARRRSAKLYSRFGPGSVDLAVLMAAKGTVPKARAREAEDLLQVRPPSRRL
jgi:hypothetical protein